MLLVALEVVLLEDVARWCSFAGVSVEAVGVHAWTAQS